MNISLPYNSAVKQQRREAMRRYRERHADKLVAYRKKQWAENREKIQEQKRRSAEKHPETARAYARKWRAENPGRSWELEKASRARNRAAIAARHKKWQLDNREQVRTYKATARARRRTRAQGRLSPDLVKRLMVLQRCRCAVCSKRLTVYHLDHVMPLYLGGEHADGNMQLLCPPCNRLKSYKAPEVFMQEQGKLL